MSQGDFDGVIEAYCHALDACLKLMIEVATAGRRRAAPSDYCRVPPAHGCVSPAFAIPNGITLGERERESNSRTGSLSCGVRESYNSLK